MYYILASGGQPHDKDNFVLLVKELKESFRPFNLLLTSAFGASKKIIDEAYDIPALSKYLDYMHIMWYVYFKFSLNENNIFLANILKFTVTTTAVHGIGTLQPMRH